MSSYRERIELLHWVRTGKPDPRGALAFYARLAALPVDYVEKRARGEVEPSISDYRRIDEVWHAQPIERHRWCILFGNRDGIVWRCSGCGVILRGRNRTAILTLSRCAEGQMTAHEKKRFA